MDIKCACGNSFFTKQMKLTKLLGTNDISEELYYTCSKCGFVVSQKEVKNYPITKASDKKSYDEIILFRDFE